jgi:hypothetical protein
MVATTTWRTLKKRFSCSLASEKPHQNCSVTEIPFLRSYKTCSHSCKFNLLYTYIHTNIPFTLGLRRSGSYSSETLTFYQNYLSTSDPLRIRMGAMLILKCFSTITSINGLSNTERFFSNRTSSS